MKGCYLSCYRTSLELVVDPVEKQQSLPHFPWRLYLTGFQTL
jgi:hypothetical protein